LQKYIYFVDRLSLASLVTASDDGDNNGDDGDIDIDGDDVDDPAPELPIQSCMLDDPNRSG